MKKLNREHLLLLHGALGSKKQFIKLKEKLESQFTVHCFDFEGHGGEVSTHNFSIDLFVENTLAYLKKNKLEEAVVFGYSMGGYVALKLALNNPNVFSKIITLGTKFNWNEESAAQEVKKLNPNLIEEKVPRFAEYLKQLHSPSSWKIVLKKTAEMMLRMGNGERLTEDDFKKITTKVVLGIGEKDEMVSLAETEKVASFLPNAQLEVLDETPHPIEKVDIQLLNKYLINAIEKS